MYSRLDELEAAVSGRSARSSGRPGAARVVALHLDFVARPNGSGDLASELALAMEDAELGKEGLEASLLLVSDREARLVTLLTFWDSRRFLSARESRIAWIEKLVAPFADGSIRTHTSLPRFLSDEAGFGPTANGVTPGERPVEQLLSVVTCHGDKRSLGL